MWMADPHVVSALKEKRALVSGLVEKLERKLEQHRADPTRISKPQLSDLLRRRRIDSLVITGAETNVRALAAVLDAIDLGYRVVLATDALCSSSDATHDALLTLYRQQRDDPRVLGLRSGLRRSDRVGHPRAAHSEGLGLAGGRFARGLMLHLGIDLGADQNDDDRDPDPGHEPDDRAERSIGLIVAAKIRHVPREQD
jgi:uncharacterized protein YlxP (DUF503 family)